MDEDERSRLRIVVVGPCAAGKTTLVNGLIARGFTGARWVAQEHSGVRNLWARRGRLDALIYLDVQGATMNRRQGRTDWTGEARAELLLRLEGARHECDLYLSTDDLTIPQVLEVVAQFLEQLSPLQSGGGLRVRPGT